VIINNREFIAVGAAKQIIIQVTYKMEAGNKERELNGLLEASRHVGTKEGLILTFIDEDDFYLDSINIKIVPAWKWLLSLEL
jgi:uncharacterized protein